MADPEQPGMLRRVSPAELRPGNVVVPNDPQLAYEVHAVEQGQGQLQVIDVDGAPHVYREVDLVEVR